MNLRGLAWLAALGLWVGAGCTSLNPARPVDGGMGGSSSLDAAMDLGGISGSGGSGAGGAANNAGGKGGVGTGIATGGAGTGGAGTAGAAMRPGGAGGAATGGADTGGSGTSGSLGGGGGSASSAGCALIMHMDEASWSGQPGEVIDSCGRNNGAAVKILGATDLLPSTTAAGRFGRAGLFDHSNGCVAVPDDPSLRATTKLTVTAWIFPTALDPASNGILGKRSDYLTDSSYTMFLWNDGDVAYHLYADVGNDRFIGKQTFSPQAWYHVALVFDGTLPAAERVRLYVNGTQDGEFAEAANTVPVFLSPLHVGCMPTAMGTPSAQEFVGKIDEVAIWTRALGAAELLQLAQATTPL